MSSHEVDPALPGSHSHDHYHGAKSPTTRSAAHDHHHLHHDDLDADNELNGHTHALPHARLPWEAAEVA